jgi:hypothetical protein
MSIFSARSFWPGVLICAGIALDLSAALNLFSAFYLFEPSDAVALGITRGEVLGWYMALLFAGALLIVLGLRLRRAGRE